jgi:hypothetical protein
MIYEIIYGGYGNNYEMIYEIIYDGYGNNYEMTN